MFTLARRCVHILALIHAKLLRQTLDVSTLIHANRLLRPVAVHLDAETVLKLSQLFDTELALQSTLYCVNVLLRPRESIKSSTWMITILSSKSDRRT